ncbi:hypothetical protein RND71_040512 [Anisodus tanguticus]|uniref:Uncharacterized protein n=1 Tax=Anisodus tanguticus TaxID=243964 RepID=A0AAE1QSR9_9SOLA|nr:hypothetical protein RND71_040512 [Anisodus tanguticus]
MQVRGERSSPFGHALCTSKQRASEGRNGISYVVLNPIEALSNKRGTSDHKLRLSARHALASNFPDVASSAAPQATANHANQMTRSFSNSLDYKEREAWKPLDFIIKGEELKEEGNKDPFSLEQGQESRREGRNKVDRDRQPQEKRREKASRKLRTSLPDECLPLDSRNESELASSMP